jgi:tetratricopeptide (TPR) repeat protein
MDRPFCFVLMPFGRRPASSGYVIDFDAVYAALVLPAIDQSGLQPLPTDQELFRGENHEAIFERVIMCDYAVADLTMASPHALYELGVRWAVKPACMAFISAHGVDAQPLDGMPTDCLPLPYKVGTNGKPANPAADSAALVQRLLAAQRQASDVPVFQLADEFSGIQRLKTDVFRERADYSPRLKERLSIARKRGVEALRAIEAELASRSGGLADVEAGVVIDLFLSYRAVKAWSDMIAIAGKMSNPLAATVMVREQLGLALNRAGNHTEAEHILRELIAQKGPSSEACGILGRIYKDSWASAVKAGETDAGNHLLEKAIDAYLQGFESDWRDGYLGINAVTLMELRKSSDPRLEKLLPVVRYAVERRIAAGKPDYWDHATLLELAVLCGDERAAYQALASALPEVREVWEPETTLQNLQLILEAQRRRNQNTTWANRIQIALAKKANLPCA